MTFSESYEIATKFYKEHNLLGALAKAEETKNMLERNGYINVKPQIHKTLTKWQAFKTWWKEP